MNQLRLLPIVLLLLAGMSHAQDIHFSQFDQAPFNLNPGLVGNFNGSYRFIGNQRTQWRSVTVPYSTFAFSADAPSLEGFSFPVGLSIASDLAGDSRLRTTVFQAAIGKRFDLSEDGSFVVVPAVMPGFTSMRIDYSALYYDNQWTGIVYDPSIDPNESYARDSRGYFNLAGGVRLERRWADDRQLTAGLAFFNLASPKQSFFDDGFVRLDPRMNVHATYTLAITDEWTIAPSMLFMTQGKYREWDLGGTAYYTLERSSYLDRRLFGGLFFRARDAGFVVAGMHYDDWRVGISYDINTSDLKPASNGRGGLEFSVVYILPPRPVAGNFRKVCPDYL